MITDEQTLNGSDEFDEINTDFIDDFLNMDDFWLEDDDFWTMEPSQILPTEEPIEVATGNEWWNGDDMFMSDEDSIQVPQNNTES